jgi:hypothetical protein
MVTGGLNGLEQSPAEKNNEDNTLHQSRVGATASRKSAHQYCRRLTR